MKIKGHIYKRTDESGKEVYVLSMTRYHTREMVLSMLDTMLDTDHCEEIAIIECGESIVQIDMED